MSEIVIIAGSNHKNLELATQFYSVFQEKEVSSSVLDLVSLALPLYTPIEEKQGIPQKIVDLKPVFENAKAFVFVAPEYNGGLPPALINFITWMTRCGDDDWRKFFNNKSAAIATFSGSGGVQALMMLRMQLSYLGVNVLGRQVRSTYQKAAEHSHVEAISELVLDTIR